MHRCRIPKLRFHAASQQGFVELAGRRLYLGPYRDPLTRQKYSRVIAEWEASGRQLPVDAASLTIVALIDRFWTWAKQYYRRADGSPSSEIESYRYALRPVLKLYGALPANEFGPRCLKAVREQMIQMGWARRHINLQVSRIRSVFRWGTEEELVDPGVHQALRAVKGLVRGRTNARETNPVQPANQELTGAIAPHVSTQVWAMIQLQLLTGCRPDEVTRLRTLDLDMRDERVWIATLGEHKTAHHGIIRRILIGPKAQDILRPFLSNRPVDAYLFSPAEAESQRRAEKTVRRCTPLSCGNVPGSNRASRPKRSPQQRYTVASYLRAIARACEVAYPLPSGLARQKVAGKKGVRWETREAWRDAIIVSSLCALGERVVPSQRTSTVNAVWSNNSAEGQFSLTAAVLSQIDHHFRTR